MSADTTVISIVVGTIALIEPFHVPRNAFLRDVLFFTAAVIMVVTVLRDGRLTMYESGSMVLLYILYVGVVVGGNWWSRRRSDKETAKALGWADGGTIGAEEGDAARSRRPSGRSLGVSTHRPDPYPFAETGPVDNIHSRGRSRASSIIHSSASNSPSLTPQRVRIRRHNSHNPPHSPEFGTTRANFSLLGAIEFRDVVNSLKRESESRGTTPIRSPGDDNRQDYFSPVHIPSNHRRASSVATLGMYGRGRQVSGSRGRQRSASNVGPQGPTSANFTSTLPSPILSAGQLSPTSPAVSPLDPASGPGSTVRPGFTEPNPWKDQLGKPPSALPTPELLLPSAPNVNRPERPKIEIPKRRQLSAPKIPSISITDPSGLPGAPSPPPESSYSPPLARESRFKVRRRTRLALRILFPSLQSFRHKSYLGMFLAITSVPAILALTVTLPVVDDGPRDEGAVALPMDDDEAFDGHAGDEFDQLDQQGEDGDVDEEDQLLAPDVGEELHHLVDRGFSPLHSPLGRIHHTALRRMASREALSPGSDQGEFAEEDVGDASKEMEEELEEEEAMEFHPVLTAVQCILGPAFCTLIIFSTSSRLTVLRRLTIR